MPKAASSGALLDKIKIYLMILHLEKLAEKFRWQLDNSRPVPIANSWGNDDKMMEKKKSYKNFVNE